MKSTKSQRHAIPILYIIKCMHVNECCTVYVHCVPMTDAVHYSADAVHCGVGAIYCSIVPCSIFTSVE